MGCLKLTYSQENTTSFWRVWKNPDTQKSCVSWYDYGARFYDPALGRWHSIDPMAEKYFAQSPYHFSGNNPVLFIDVDGMQYGTNPFFQIGGHRLLGGFGSGNSVLLNAMDRLKQQTQEEWQDQQDYYDMINQGIAVAKSYSPEKHEASVSVTGTISGKYEDGGGFDWDISQSSKNGSSIGGVTTVAGLEIAGVGAGLKDYAKSNQQYKYGQRGVSGNIHRNNVVTRASKIQAYKYARYAKTAGRAVGFLGAGITAWEGAMDGDFTWGDAAQVGIAIGTIFTPYGWAYGLVDLGVGLTTKQSVSERIGTAIDDW